MRNVAPSSQTTSLQAYLKEDGRPLWAMMADLVVPVRSLFPVFISSASHQSKSFAWPNDIVVCHSTSVVIRPCSCHRIPRTAGSGAIGDGYHPSDRIRRWRTAPLIVEDDDVVLSSLTLITKHTPNISYQTSKRSNDGTISCESPLVSRQLHNTLKVTPSSVLSTTTLYYLLSRQVFQPI